MNPGSRVHEALLADLEQLEAVERILLQDLALAGLAAQLGNNSAPVEHLRGSLVTESSFTVTSNKETVERFAPATTNGYAKPAMDGLQMQPSAPLEPVKAVNAGNVPDKTSSSRKTREPRAPAPRSSSYDIQFDKPVRAERGYDEESIAIYLKDIGRHPLLTKDDEVDLSKKVQAGIQLRTKMNSDPTYAPDFSERRALKAADRAKDTFICSNLRLVVSIARRYPLPQGMELLDLIQEGNLGLEHAVDKFDWQRGFKFSTYATFWIRQAIGRALDQKSSTIRIPGDKAANLRAKRRQATSDGTRLDDETARLEKLATTTSLNQYVGDDHEAELGDLIPAKQPGPDNQLLLNELRDKIDRVLPPNSSNHAVIMFRLRMGLDTDDGQKLSFREIGERFGITAEAARRNVTRYMESHVDYLRVELGGYLDI